MRENIEVLWYVCRVFDSTLVRDLSQIVGTGTRYMSNSDPLSVNQFSNRIENGRCNRPGIRCQRERLHPSNGKVPVYYESVVD